MISSAKPNASILAMAQVLMDTVHGPDELEQAILADLADQPGVDTYQVRQELVCLRAFAAEWVITIMLDESVEKEAILGTYRGLWEKDSEKTDLYECVQSRLVIYWEVMNAAPDTLAEVIGGVFARLCQSEENKKLVLAGSAMFTALIEGIGGTVAMWKPRLGQLVK